MNLTKILPVENYHLAIDLPVEEVHKRLANCIETSKNSTSSSLSRTLNKPYEGKILENSFSIKRVIQYRNSFLPVISGQIIPHQNHVEIKIKMKPIKIVIIFMSLWLGLVGLFCIVILAMGIVQFQQIIRNGFSPFALIPFILFLLGYSMLMFAFKFEARRSKYFLTRLFEPT